MLINENWKIESDQWNCILLHRNTGKKEWRAVSYFDNPQDCLERLAKFEVYSTGLEDMKTVIKKFGELNALIKTIKTLPGLLEHAPAISKQSFKGNGRSKAVAAA